MPAQRTRRPLLHRLGVGGVGLAAYFPSGPKGVKGARDELAGPCLADRIGGPRLEQLGIRENHAKLIVQPVEEQTQLVQR